MDLGVVVILIFVVNVRGTDRASKIILLVM